MNGIEGLGPAFFELHRDMPREGPGDDGSTLRALALCTELPMRPAILDIGCGPGMQTVALAGATNGTVTAVDMHEPFLDQLRERADAAGVRERVQIMRADMADLPFGPDSFDLIWCEGATFIMGLDAALAAWREFLRPGGYIVLSDLAFLASDMPTEVHEFFTGFDPNVCDVDANLEKIQSADYEVIDHFTLPYQSWWTHYYTPLSERIPDLLEKYADDETALATIQQPIAEMDIRRRYPDSYGYEFYVIRLTDPDAPRAPEPEEAEEPEGNEEPEAATEAEGSMGDEQASA